MKVTLMAWLIIQLISKWNTEFQIWMKLIGLFSQTMSHERRERSFVLRCVWVSVLESSNVFHVLIPGCIREVKTTLGGERSPFVFRIFGMWTTFLLNINPSLGQKAVNEKAFWCLYILTAVATAHHSFEDVLKSFRLFGFKDAHFKLNWNI